jgi:hypothetical protein
MELLKRYFRLKANSILESVIALSIISICLFIAVMVYSVVFTPKTSSAFYVSKNKADELFFLMQLEQDSIYSNEEDYSIKEEWQSTFLKKVTITAKDSTSVSGEKKYYIRTFHE